MSDKLIPDLEAHSERDYVISERIEGNTAFIKCKTSQLTEAAITDTLSYAQRIKETHQVRNIRVNFHLRTNSAINPAEITCGFENAIPAIDRCIKPDHVFEIIFNYKYSKDKSWAAKRNLLANAADTVLWGKSVKRGVHIGNIEG